MTGSKYLLEHGGTRGPGRLRPVPGAEGAALRNWAEFPSRRGDRRRRPDPRAPRSRRLPAAAGRAGLQGPRLLHAGHQGSVRARAARCRPHPGRGRRQANKHGYSKHHPALPLYTESDALRADAAAAGRLREPDRDRAGHLDRVHPAGHLLGLGVRVRDCTDGPTFCSAATSVATPARAARSEPRRADVLLCRVDLRRSRSPADDDGERWRRSSRHRRARRQADHPGVCHRPRRGAALLDPQARGGAPHSRCCPSTSTARWPSRR